MAERGKMTDLKKEIEKIFDTWNNSSVSELTKHKSIVTKLSSQKCTKLFELNFTPSIYTAIEYSLLNYTSEQILEAMGTYFEIVSSDAYWYKDYYVIKSLPEWLTSPKGLLQFLSVNRPYDKFRKNTYKKDPITLLRNKFIPLTRRYNASGILNKEQRTFYGFDIDQINDISYIDGLIFDIREMIRDKEDLRFGHFEWLEKCLASVLFRRKTFAEEEFIKLFTELISLWEFYKDKFAESAKKILDDLD